MVKRAIFTKADLRAAIDSIPRTRMAHIPTPLEECTRFSQALGGPRIFIKRDDLTGLAFGGNKARHIEFRIADALERGCDCFVSSFVSVSNYARMISAACAKVGMKAIFVVRAGKSNVIQGNMLLEHLMDTEFHFLETGDREEAMAYCRELAEKLKAQGHVPYLANDYPIAMIAGTIGYLDCTIELAEQMEDMGIGPAYIYLVGGTSMAGLALGAKLLGLPWKVVGISSGDRPNIHDGVFNYANRVKEHLGLPLSLEEEDFDLYDEYVGEEYAVPTKEGVEAVRLLASTEAIFLDPTYTGKAMGGLIDHIRKGILGPSDTVVFIHTGGTPALFMQEYREPLTTW